MRVLGVKVTDELYDRFGSLDGSISENLKKAIDLYLKSSKDEQLTKVNHDCFDCKYKDLYSLMDKYLNLLAHYPYDLQYAHGCPSKPTVSRAYPAKPCLPVLSGRTLSRKIRLLLG